MDTPARRAGFPVRDGVHRLPSAAGEWRDQGEPEVEAALRSVSDRSSASAELAAHERTWETTYHFAAERANIVRGLRIHGGMRVLEIGAGCGAVTRRLGETAGAVDALEPTPERARAAALRCADLDAVRVFQGLLEDLPAEPAYDLVVVVGVLEYVGGRDGHEQRLAFLRGARERLLPGGAVACAIENRLGVQYLCGAPEEHLGRSFAGLEDYPEPGPARTFDRAHLEGLFRDAGLHPRVLGVFPDYKFARIVFSDALLESDAAALAWRAPAFPSRATPHPRPKLASEEAVWRSLVRAGLGGEFPNSWLVVATPGPEDPSPWPEDRLAAFWTLHRRPEYATQTALRRDLTLERIRIAPPEQPGSGPLLHRPEPEARWTPGLPLSELMERAPDDDALAALLRRWRGHVEATFAAPANVDVGPQHVLQTADGLRTVDVEWHHEDYTCGDVIERGLLTTAVALADRRAPVLWGDAATTAGVLRRLAALSGVEGLDVERAVRREAELLAAITRGTTAAAVRRDLEAALERPLSEGPLGDRATEAAAAVHERAAELHHEVDRLHAEVARRDREIAALRERRGLRGLLRRI